MRFSQPTSPHIPTRIDDFCAAAQTNQTIQAVLDLPVPSGWRPPVIQSVTLTLPLANF